MRLVLDTNVVISGLLWGGQPERLIRTESHLDIQLFTAAPLLAELTKSLDYPKFKRKIATIGASVEELVDGYSKLAIIVTPNRLPRIAPDPDDDVVIGTALAAKADLLVTGDRALLSVSKYEGVRIVSVQEALDAIARSVAQGDL